MNPPPSPAKALAAAAPTGGRPPFVGSRPMGSSPAAAVHNTPAQARTQFSLWALFPAPLLISQNMLRWSAFALETYSNEEVYASATPSFTSGNSRK